MGSNSILIFLGRTLLSLYKGVFSAHIGGGCRFHPSCSDYAVECYDLHPFFVATKLVFLRLSKCHPFGASGFDPVPELGARK